MATTTELEERIKQLEERLRAMEDDRRYAPGRVLDELVPSETRRHMRAAWKEQLLAMRSVLDHWIEKQENGGSTRAKRHESISVE
jgi:hypothetical protein